MPAMPPVTGWDMTFGTSRRGRQARFRRASLGSIWRYGGRDVVQEFGCQGGNSQLAQPQATPTAGRSMLSRSIRKAGSPTGPIPEGRRRRAAGAPPAWIGGRRRSARRLPTRDSGQRSRPAPTRRRPRPTRPPPHLHATKRPDSLEDDQDAAWVAGQVAQLHIAPWRSRPRRLHRSSGTTREWCERRRPCGRSSAPRERGLPAATASVRPKLGSPLGAWWKATAAAARDPGVRFPMPAARCGRSGAAAAPGPAAGCR
jgi:hypothetical protein